MFWYGITDVVAALAFVLSYFFFFDQNIYWAAGLFMIALATQYFILNLLFNMKISPFMGVAFILGVATTIIAVVLQLPIAIQWRPTAISWFFAAVCLIALGLGREYVQKWIFKYWMLLLPGRLWKYQTLVNVTLFLLGGIVNLVVAYSFSEQIWVLYLAIAWILWAQFGSLLSRFIVSMEHRRIGDTIIFDGEEIDMDVEQLPSKQ